jgi:predicted O-methyltransferase YrrM
VRCQYAAQNPLELAELADWLGGRRPPARVLEIGVFLGGTAWLWRRLWPRARLVGVDLEQPPCPPCERRQAHRECPRRRVDEAGMQLLLGDSGADVTRARVQAALGGPVGFLHIDGDHSYEAVRRDFELYAPLVEPGGAIALHDVAGEAYPGAVRFWTELTAERPTAFLIHEHGSDWGGFGVVPI